MQPYIRLLVVAFGLWLELGAFACSADAPTGAPSASTVSASLHASAPSSNSASTCGRATIEAAVGRFVRAWNGSDVAALHRLFTTDAIVDMSGKNQSESTTDLTGWDEIKPFSESQLALGQTLSFSSLQVVDSEERTRMACGRFTKTVRPRATRMPSSSTRAAARCSPTSSS